MIKKEGVWNIVLTSLATAAIAILGWLALSVIQLQNQYAAETAEKELREDVTDVMNDVDKRLAVIEAVMIFRRSEEPAEPAPVPIPVHPMQPNFTPHFDPFMDDGGEEESALEEPQQQMQQQQQFEAPRYNLRKRSD